jgi:NADH-ubiquinone oxidoreductase chain 2
LLGTGIIFSYTGTTSLESLYIINSVIEFLVSCCEAPGQQYIIQGISLGLTLIFIGFLFKIAAAPLHNWSPDVYDGTPTIVTTWLTIIPKISILILLLELQLKLGIEGGFNSIINNSILHSAGYLQNISLNFTDSSLAAEVFGFVLGLKQQGNNILKSLLLITSTLSLIVGSLLGLAQIRIKRLLAYSTISHIGFILLALAVNTEPALAAFIFYIIQYTITNLNIFLVILGLTYIKFASLPTSYQGLPNPNLYFYLKNEDKKQGKSFSPIVLRQQYKDISYISEFKGLFFSNPLLSLSLSLSLFSMAGIPPLIGFFSKQLVLYSALQNGYYFISLVAIIVSVISCSYYLQIIKVLFTNTSDPSNYNYLTKEQSLEFTSEDFVKDHSSSYSCSSNATSPSTCEAKSKKDVLVVPFAVVVASPQLQEPILRSFFPEGEQVLLLRREIGKNLTNTHSYLISALTFTILLFFIKPSLILNSTQLLSLSLFFI